MMKKFFGICAAILMLCTAIFPTKTFAQEDDGIAAFREALLSDSDAKERIFRQDILFASPMVMAELDIMGMAEGEAFKSKGDFSMWIYNDDGSVTEKIIPYYITQSGKNMEIYFKADKKWEKFTAPSLAAAITDFIATPTPEEVEKIIDETKEVTILKENDYRRIMLVHMDCEKLADSMKLLAEENPADNVAAGESELQNTFMTYMDMAIRNADIWYMWTIDKRDWHTVEMQYNLSGLIQEFARAALNDPDQVWPDEISNLLETIAYYSEIRAYTTYPSDPAAKKLFEIPKKVLKATPVNDIVK